MRFGAEGDVRRHRADGDQDRRLAERPRRARRQEDPDRLPRDEPAQRKLPRTGRGGVHVLRRGREGRGRRLDGDPARTTTCPPASRGRTCRWCGATSTCSRAARSTSTRTRSTCRTTSARDRMGFYAGALKSAGFFEPGAKYGIVRYDTSVAKDFADRVIRRGDGEARPEGHGRGRAHETAERRRRGDDREPGRRTRWSGSRTPASTTSCGSRPAARSRSSWAPTADTQKYFPRSAFTSLDIPNFVDDNMSVDQLKRAVVIGWMPPNDTYGKYLPKPKQYNDCKQASGVPDNMSGGAQLCDGLFFLKAAFDKTPQYGVAGPSQGGRVSRDRLRVTVDDLHAAETRTSRRCDELPASCSSTRRASASTTCPGRRRSRSRATRAWR